MKDSMLQLWKTDAQIKHNQHETRARRLAPFTWRDHISRKCISESYHLCESSMGILVVDIITGLAIDARLHLLGKERRQYHAISQVD